MLVVDTSGSMGEAGMATVRTAVAAFLKDVPKDVSVGLVSFAATAGVDVPPTKDRARVQKAVNALRSRGETTLYDGVALAAAGLAGYDDRSLVLLSDGGDTRSTKATKASATAALKRNGVRAEVIGFKTDDSDNTVLKGFAAAGGGSVAAAGNDDAVRQAFEAAAKALDSQVTFTFTPDSSRPLRAGRDRDRQGERSGLPEPRRLSTSALRPCRPRRCPASRPPCPQTTRKAPSLLRCPGRTACHRSCSLASWLLALAC